jgi:hypothetical protein
MINDDSGESKMSNNTLLRREKNRVELSRVETQNKESTCNIEVCTSTIQTEEEMDCSS